MNKTQILNKALKTGQYVTTSDRAAKMAKAIPELQHVYSMTIMGQMTHRFIIKKTCNQV